MASHEQPAKASKTERGLRFFRDINALGAVAVGGVAVALPGPNVVLASWTVLNAAQAGGFELLRQRAHGKSGSGTAQAKS